MGHRVCIEPSGHSFTVLPEESLLEAALRSGMNVKYSCNNGTCGECKVRLLDGEVAPVMPSAYRFSTQERNEGFVLMCANRPTGDLVIEAQEALSPRDIPLQRLSAKVARVDSPSPRVRILQLRTPRTQTLRFMAGQHVCLTLPEVGRYDAAVASCPCNGMHLQFHLPYRPGEPFLDALYEGGLRVGRKVEVEGPYGDITLDDDAGRPLLMLAMGTEIAPIKSLMEHAINLDVRQPIRLIWLAPEEEGHYLDNHCRAWAEVLDDYRFVPLSMSGAEPDSGDMARVKEAIEAQLQGLEGVDAYVAGSRTFSEVAREHLLTLGVASERVFQFQRRQPTRAQRLSANGF